MKPTILLLLRVSTGVLLMLWASVKLFDPESATGVSDAFYGGVISGRSVQLLVGVVQMALGALVILGLLRRIVYPLQTAWLGLGLLAVWAHVLNPLGENSNLLFFPSTTVFLATLVVLAWRSDDTFSLDAKVLGRA